MALLKKMKEQFITGDGSMSRNKTPQAVINLPLHLVMPNKNQPRKNFDHDSLRELSESIREYGVIQPVTVRRQKDGTYQLVAGERRLRAAGLAGLLKIPAIITEMEDEDSAVVALIENIQRQDLTFMEEAFAYRALIDKCDCTQEELAKKIGKTQSAIANKMRLLKLPVSVREIIKDNSLTERHARALLRLDTEEKQLYAVKKFADFGMSVKQADSLVDRVIKRGIEEPKQIKNHSSIGDARIFYKTITKAINLMNESGIEATAQKDETDSYYEYVIRIQKA